MQMNFKSLFHLFLFDIARAILDPIIRFLVGHAYCYTAYLNWITTLLYYKQTATIDKQFTIIIFKWQSLNEWYILWGSLIHDICCKEALENVDKSFKSRKVKL